MLTKLVPFSAVVAILGAACGLPDPSRTYQVQYRVTGTAASVNITIQTPSGTEQRSVPVPYSSPVYTFKGMDYAYISAQNTGETGSVTVEILVDGSPLKRASSEGAYMIASTDWLVGSDR